MKGNKMVDKSRYQNGKIYKLVNNVDDNIYIGSTCSPLHQRLSKHKHSSKVHPYRNVYKHINEVGWENTQIILIEKYPCNDIDELLQRERYWIDKHKPKLNVVLPKRSNAEYYEDNKERFIEHNKQYREKTKDEKAKYDKIYYENNKEKKTELSRKYYNENKHEIKETNKIYRENNKDIINQKKREYGKQPWTCDICSCTIRQDNRIKHLKSKIHIENSTK